MKKAEEYLDGIWETEFNGLDELDYFNILAIIKRVQEEAIRETVKECANSATLEWDFVHGTSIDKNSILSIADKLIKEL